MARAAQVPRMRAMSRRCLRLHAWIASLVILLSACLPAVGQVLRHADPLTFAAVCSAEAARNGPADAGNSAGDGSGAAAGGHCPLCVLHAHGVALPPAPFTLALVAGLSQAAPYQRAVAAPVPALAPTGWPRAPPLQG